MTPYLVVLLFLICSYFCFEYTKPFKGKKLIFAIFGYSLLIFLSSFKATSVGSDTQTYYDAYIYLKSTNIGTVYRELDKGFCILFSIFAHLNLPFNVTLFILYVVIYIPFILFSSSFTKNPTIVVLFTFMFQMFTFMMSGLRQSLSIALCLMALFSLLKIKRKYISIPLFTLLIVFSSFFHTSALIFLLVLPVVLFLRNKLLNPLLIIPICFISALLSPYLYSLIFFLIEGSFFYDPPHNVFFLDIGFSTYIIIGGCLIFYLFKNYEDNKRIKNFLDKLLFNKKIFDNKSVSASQNEMIFFNISMIDAVLICVVSCSQVFVRIGYYFNPIFALIVPSAIYCIKQKWLRSIIFSFVVFALVVFFYFSVYKDNYLTIFPYEFNF